MTPARARLAVLVDAENVAARHLEPLLTEIGRHGVATIKRAYGDWTARRLASWKPMLLANSVIPVQQFSYTSGKNASDSTLIIDAMDLLHAGHLDGFCLVSSDSDFTRLAARIREQGLFAHGFGQAKTPQAFVSACDRFHYLEQLAEAASPSSAADARPSATPALTTLPSDESNGRALLGDERLHQLLVQAVQETADSQGWASMSTVGNRLAMLSPGFRTNAWGFARLSALLNAHPEFEVRPGNSFVRHDPQPARRAVRPALSVV